MRGESAQSDKRFQRYGYSKFGKIEDFQQKCLVNLLTGMAPKWHQKVTKNSIIKVPGVITFFLLIQITPNFQ